jgi:SAM-dependent methyltransferase
MRAEAWRGSPTATDKSEFMELVDHLKPRKDRDVFYDLGCGYANPCVWIAPKVKLSVGIENHEYRYTRALSNVSKSGHENVRIMKMDIEDAIYEDATIIHSVISLNLGMFRKIRREPKNGSVVVALAYCPLLPIKCKEVGHYFVMRTPFEVVESEEEYARIFTGREDGTMEEVLEDLPRRDAKYLKWTFERKDWILKELG